ncbi:hypothetical protein IID24_04075 [Patescibacteria group bacterium]|nr:hypothetical protein [Patescibacteria group bacterium]
MKVLYLSETEGLQVLSLENVLDKFVKTGINPIDLKDMIKSIDAQGFFIGNSIFGSYTVICLGLPNYTISIQAREKEKKDDHLLR